MGFTEILTIVFVVLKATGHLNWSWWLVFTPELIAGAFYLITLLSVIGIGSKVVRKLCRPYQSRSRFRPRRGRRWTSAQDRPAAELSRARPTRGATEGHLPAIPAGARLRPALSRRGWSQTTAASNGRSTLPARPRASAATPPLWSTGRRTVSLGLSGAARSLTTTGRTSVISHSGLGEMLHRAKVAKDVDSRWAAVCDCSYVWHCARWRDAYDAAYSHVYNTRYMDRLGGIGFRSVRK